MIEGTLIFRSGVPGAVVLALALLLIPGVQSFAQIKPDFPPGRSDERGSRDSDEAKTIGEMVMKQQITRRRKEHEELIKRGEEALKLSEELESSISTKEALTPANVEKLESLEKLVGRIRKDLGGDDEEAIAEPSVKEKSARQSISSALRFLKESTRTLVDELKRTSRFSISAIAIQTSNSVIRFARFLRLKK